MASSGFGTRDSICVVRVIPWPKQVCVVRVIPCFSVAYTGHVDLRVYPAESPIAAFVVAHGAGAGQMSQFMVRAASGLASRGISTATFDFPYIAAGRRIPDRAPVLEAAWREAIDIARGTLPALPLFIGGKSMGGRMTSTAQAEEPLAGVAGLAFLGFPLHPPGKPSVSRADHLFQVRVPMLFLQGSRDDFAELGLITGVCERLGPRARLEVLEGADHSFRVPKRKGEQVIGELADRVLCGPW